MCDAQGSQKRPSKYGRGGKALAKALLVRFPPKFVNLLCKLFMVSRQYGFNHVWLGVGVSCRKKPRLGVLSLMEIATVGQESEQVYAKMVSVT
jgi:hypothetical protein